MSSSELTNIRKKIHDYQHTIDTLVKEKQKEIFRHNFIKYFDWDFKKFGDFHLEMVINGCDDIYVSFKLVFQGKTPMTVNLKTEYLTFDYNEYKFIEIKGFSTIKCEVSASLEGHILLAKRNIFLPTDLTACDRDDYKKLLKMAMAIRNSSELIV
tara:strand:- start:1983 stop:2447 length:465 start_codon:yes stop_codon:yes gene_type:complete